MTYGFAAGKKDKHLNIVNFQIMFTDVVAPVMNFKYNFTFTNDGRAVFSSVGDGRCGKTFSS